MYKPRLVVLVIDDEPGVRESLAEILKYEFEVLGAEDGAAGLQIIRSRRVDVVLLDVRLPGERGPAVLPRILALDDSLPVILMTAVPDVRTAVECIKAGAYEYLVKPFDVDEILLLVRQAAQQRVLEREVCYLREELDRTHGVDALVGRHPAMVRLYETITQVAQTHATVLITAETGTGKELVARAIHFNSQRRTKPFVSVNCGAIPEALMESELFGHVKGAFTGAVANKVGLFSAAEAGTLFLDEITEIPTLLQVKLLRAIQEREVRRVGDTRDLKVDVRLIAASNRELEQAVSEGVLREDLFYRLNVIPIHLPPLRERREDIALLVAHFLQKFGRQLNKDVRGVTPEALAILERYHWPGNIRELENVLERAIVLGGGEVLGADALPESVRRERPMKALEVELPEDGMDLEATLDALERRYLQRALDRSGGVQTKAAELLRMTFRQFRYKLQKHNMARRGTAVEE
ncbi:MAG TPA: Fis family transcriptional regulator [Candidatus Rokubacteria bacterium]|nr:Fis family transcriptional regulator [Candidatus Rokubacteria bacterium]